MGIQRFVAVPPSEYVYSHRITVLPPSAPADHVNVTLPSLAVADVIVGAAGGLGCALADVSGVNSVAKSAKMPSAAHIVTRRRGARECPPGVEGRTPIELNAVKALFVMKGTLLHYSSLTTLFVKNLKTTCRAEISSLSADAGRVKRLLPRRLGRPGAGAGLVAPEPDG